MGKPYQNELKSLDATYAAALGVDIGLLADALAEAQHLPLVSVGSGGSFTAAHLAACLHERFCGTVARAATPLDAARFTQHGVDKAVMLLTAGGSNPDVLGVFKHLAESEPAKLIVLCGRKQSPLALKAAAYPYVDAFSFQAPGGKDGFLATNSLLWFATLLIRAYRAAQAAVQTFPADLDQLLHPQQSRPDFLESLRMRCRPLWGRPTLIVLHGPETASAGVDLESKFTEAALGVVQLADFRSFAHGRHHWLAKHGDESAVLALATDADSELALRTLNLLPRSVPSVLLPIAGTAVTASLAALVTAFFVAGQAGIARDIDPGRPGVPSFGRKIYHLRTFQARTSPTSPGGSPSPAAIAAIERKSGLSLEQLNEQGQLQNWLAAYRGFVARLFATKFSSVVLDYDGTLCATKERLRGVQPQAVAQLARIARAGITVCIVTGRGKSVRKDLQRGLAKDLWDRFIIGYYNGSDISTLGDGTRPLTGGCCEDLVALNNFLRRGDAIGAPCEYEPKPRQIVVKPQARLRRDRLLQTLQHAVQVTSSRATVVRSGHSFDILSDGVSKQAVIERLARDYSGAVLCIGDSGRWPGNDFSLLTHEFSLSVHEVSTDPLTCWNLAPSGYRGVSATLYYLQGLVLSRANRSAILRLPAHGKGRL